MPLYVRGLRVPAVLVALTALMAGCAAWMGGGADGLTDPFTITSRSDDGFEMSVSGFTRGYRAGQEVEFPLWFQNMTDASVQDRYCLMLVDDGERLAVFADRRLDLAVGVGMGTTARGTVPAGLADGYYGLALSIPGRFTSVTTIAVGDAPDPGEPAQVFPGPGDTETTARPTPGCP